MRNSKEPVEAVIEKIKQSLGALGGEIEALENLGQREFARVADRRFPNGIYIEVRFSAPASAPEAIHEKFHLDRTVDRIMIQSR